VDETQLLTALTAGAAIAGAELVKETTKDTYRALKNAVASSLGKRTELAIEKVEASLDDEAAKLALKEALPALAPQEADDLGRHVTALLQALKADPVAVQVIDTVARIRLDVDAGGQVILEDIRGARQIDVRAKAAGDFTMRAVEMDPEKQRGNR
jgi:hypothetical protein